ncbi:MAG: hypothetical protein LBV30_10725 [Propionibacteriaceae bacterium]|jgi:tight adherence protein B|nr:hypothetical protein [Propionibacteriaceae bacterium]
MTGAMAMGALALGLACWLLVPGTGSGRASPARGKVRRGLAHKSWLGLILLPIILAGVIFEQLVIVAGLVEVVSVLMILAQRARGSRQMTKNRQLVARSSEVLANLMSVGHVPSRAAQLAADQCLPLKPVAAAIDIGIAPGDAFVEVGQLPGYEQFLTIGRAWQVSARSGASLVATLESVNQSAVEHSELQDVATTEASASLATGRMLAVLPLLGLAMALMIGGDPLGFFTGSIAGRLCLLSGLGLIGLGLIWTDRLIDQATGGRQIVAKSESR